MRAQISYSIDVKDIPAEVKKLLLELKENNSIKNSFAKTFEALANNDETHAIKIIDALRQELTKIDARLLDCSNILAGYHEVTNKEEVSNEEG
tara:strand:+ start:779 stop:1057 length:279 start_codon:yes stop_codon:yes gene_type:complete